MFVAQSGPSPLRRDFARFYRSIREGELETALDELARAPERAAVSAAAILRAAFVDVPTGGVAPVLRELARVLRERWETRERARSRALSLRREAAILAVSPLAFVLLIGASSPGYLSAYRSAAGTLVSLVGALVIVGLLSGDAAARPDPRAGRKGGEAMSGVVAGFLVFSARRAAAGVAPLRGEDAGVECAAGARARRDRRGRSSDPPRERRSEHAVLAAGAARPLRAAAATGRRGQDAGPLPAREGWSPRWRCR